MILPFPGSTLCFVLLLYHKTLSTTLLTPDLPKEQPFTGHRRWGAMLGGGSLGVLEAEPGSGGLSSAASEQKELP